MTQSAPSHLHGAGTAPSPLVAGGLEAAVPCGRPVVSRRRGRQRRKEDRERPKVARASPVRPGENSPQVTREVVTPRGGAEGDPDICSLLLALSLAPPPPPLCPPPPPPLPPPPAPRAPPPSKAAVARAQGSLLVLLPPPPASSPRARRCRDAEHAEHAGRDLASPGGRQRAAAGAAAAAAAGAALECRVASPARPGSLSPARPQGSRLPADDDEGYEEGGVGGGERGAARGAPGRVRGALPPHTARHHRDGQSETADNISAISSIIISSNRSDSWSSGIISLLIIVPSRIIIIISAARRSDGLVDSIAAPTRSTQEAPFHAGAERDWRLSSAAPAAAAAPISPSVIVSSASARGGFVCQLCRCPFPAAVALARHRCSRLALEEQQLPCPECGKKFACPANLASHRRWHRVRREPRARPLPVPPLVPPPRAPRAPPPRLRGDAAEAPRRRGSWKRPPASSRVAVITSA
ncbi:unnamed protein product [Lampetra fluviatilis]